MFHFSIDNLHNLTILLFTPTSCIDFILSYVECCQMLSGNEYRLYLNSHSSSCSPYILLLMLLIDPCKIFFQDDIPICVCVCVCLCVFVYMQFVLCCALQTDTLPCSNCSQQTISKCQQSIYCVIKTSLPVSSRHIVMCSVTE